jgi:hypothetical protein
VRSDPVVAVVDGKAVTAGDIRKIVEISPPSFVQSVQKDPVQAVKAYFLMHYLGEQGKKLRLDEESPLKEQLEEQRMNVLGEAYFNHQLNAYTPSAEEMDGYYAKNQASYLQVRISGIKLSFRADASAGVSPEAVAEAARRAVLEAHGVANRSEAEAKKLTADIVKRLLRRRRPPRSGRGIFGRSGVKSQGRRLRRGHRHQAIIQRIGRGPHSRSKRGR